jgi:hypothetical protein
MDAIELGVLQACQEVVRRQRELLPLLAAAVGVPEDQVFYTWALRRCPQQPAKLSASGWVAFFHGLECDLKNVADGRFLRIDFGPHGRADTFTAWGVLQFIMTSVPPWPDLPPLKAYFARSKPPYDHLSGAFDKMTEVWDRLEAQAAFEKADLRLVEFAAGCTSVGMDGMLHLRFPPGTTEETIIDCLVAHRPRLSQHGLQTLQQHLADAGQAGAVRI